MSEQSEFIKCDHCINSHKLCLNLSHIMILINSSQDAEEILYEIVEESCEALGCESARIAMREGGHWVIKYVYNLPEEPIGRTFTDSELPHAALAMETKEPIVIDNAVHDDRTNTEMMKYLGIKSILVLPLIQNDLVIGTLSFDYLLRAIPFADFEIDYAERVAKAVAVAFQSVRLNQDLEESKKLGNALIEIDTILYSAQDYDAIMNHMLQLSTDAIGAESGVIFSREGDKWTVRYEYKLPMSIHGQNFSSAEVMHTALTVETKRSLVVQDTLNSREINQKFVKMLGIRSLLDFPLIIKGEVIGDLTYHYHSSNIHFNERQVEFVRKLQISISLALENARLLDKTKQSVLKEKEVNLELEAFNYTVAHDLRKPLSVINGYCQVLMEINKDEECRSYLNATYVGTLNMNRLIDALLDFSHAAHAEPKREPIDLSEIANSVALELKMADPERKVVFLISEEVVAEADKELLRIVLANLLGNAWKYTSKREEGVIEFGSMEMEGKQIYIVRDNGLGFDPAEADKMFAPFERLEAGKDVGGLGIGLATVGRIIKRHGGEVWAEGEPGKGATIYFTISPD